MQYVKEISLLSEVRNAMKPECLKVKLKKNLRLKWSNTKEGIFETGTPICAYISSNTFFFFSKLIERLQYGNPRLENFSTWLYSVKNDV